MGSNSDDVIRNKRTNTMELKKGVIISLVLMLAFVIELNAQPPLSKKNQKKKEAFEAQIAAEEQYAHLIEQADQAFKAKKYVKARMTYQEAVNYNAEMEQWLISKVNDLDILMAKNIARQIDSITVIPQKEAEKTHDDLEIAQTLRKRDLPIPKPILQEADVASELNPKSIEPKEVPVQVTVAEEKVELEKPREEIQEPKIEAPKPIVRAAKPVIKKPEVKVKDDFAALPQGMTEEEFNYPNHHVVRIVVKDGIDTIVYKRVKHKWGGDFCFKDDVSISERIWMEEVDGYRLKFER